MANIASQIERACYADEFIKSIAGGSMSFEAGILVSGQNLAAGTVLGKTTATTATAAIKGGGGNTGNGVFTIDPTTPALGTAKAGIYTARLTTVQANAGIFTVEDPDGNVTGTYVVGAAAFADDIKFTIADGATDFVLGDGFDITVSAAPTKYTILAPTAVDGSQVAAAILRADVDASAGDKPCSLLARLAAVDANLLTWPGGITAAQKAAGLAQLGAVNIFVR